MVKDISYFINDIKKSFKSKRLKKPKKSKKKKCGSEP